MGDVLILVGLVVAIVIATAKFRLHAFVVLLGAALLGGLAFGLPLADSTDADGNKVLGIPGIVQGGFGGILGYIGLVIVLGTIIGVILERSGAAITMADVVVRRLGSRFPTLTMSIIGYIVSIPVFCDSGFVILNSLRESMARKMSVSPLAMSIALATGLYATHTFVPPTPGPISAAGELGLGSDLGLVILVGLPIAAVTALTGWFWANRFLNVAPDGDSEADAEHRLAEFEGMRERLGNLPSPSKAFAPIFAPILLIMVASIVNLPAKPIGSGLAFRVLQFIGNPLVALLIGLLFAVALIADTDRLAAFGKHVGDGISASAPIILITGAGGAFGAVIKATPIADFIGSHLSDLGAGIFVPFVIAAALKSAQGSSTTALIVTASLVSGLLPELGLDSQMGRVLTVMAIGCGAMTVSHANDSFFWVVAQFSKMSVPQAYRAQTLATLAQGLTGMAVVFGVSLVAI